MKRYRARNAYIPPEPDETEDPAWPLNPLVKPLRGVLRAVFYQEVFDYAGFTGDSLGEE